MAIPENQLATWSAQGSVAQSAATYETIKNALNDPTTPYYSRLFTIFLQGSYGNHTNVLRDSDVDIIIRLDDVFDYDISSLVEPQKEAFKQAYSSASYTFDQFKAEVLASLATKYGSAVINGSKAITIRGNGTRRDADVLVCLTHRRYSTFISTNEANFHDGICFHRADGTKIINFPKQHSANCTTKHQMCQTRFKPMVRVIKNIRNRMVDAGVLQEGVAPSYFLEGLLWNMPNNKFEPTYTATFINCMDWAASANVQQLTCANNLHWLVRDGSAVCWNRRDYDIFLSSIKQWWDAF
jgi:hypothetical protein